MTVLIAGIGADTENMDVPPTLNDDRSFKYIPMPEKSVHTTEEKTVGDFVNPEGLNYIKPANSDGEIRDTEEIHKFPVHHDPNFEYLTYGEAGREDYVDGIMENLCPGDLIAFYTGLKQEPDQNLDRFIIGYFTVNNICTISKDWDTDKKERILSNYPENAHYKRFKGNGDKLFLFDNKSGQDGMEEMVIVDGKEPGGLLNSPYKVSYQNSHNYQHYIEQDFLDEFEGEIIGQESCWANRKPAIRLNLTADEFIEKMPPVQ